MYLSRLAREVVMLREYRRDGVPGVPLAAALALLFLGGAYVLVRTLIALDDGVGGSALLAVALGLGLLLIVGAFVGFFVVNPNEGKVLQFFGDYRGTAREPGLRWSSPFYTR